MAIIKCKTCGRDMELPEDRTVVTCKYCGSTVTLPGKDEPADPNVTAGLRLGRRALADRDWEAADGIFDQVLDLDAECAEAFFGTALAALECSGKEEFIARRSELREQRIGMMFACQPDERALTQMAEELTVPGYLPEGAIREKLAVSVPSFSSKTAAWEKQRKEESALWENEGLLGRAVRYAKGDFADELTALRETVRKGLETGLAGSKAQDEKNRADGAEQYRRELEAAAQAVRDAHEEAVRRKRADYEALCRKQEAAATEKEFADLAALFGHPGFRDYEDCAQRAEQCRAEASRRKAEAEALEEEKARLQEELARLKGLFSGKRRREIEARLAKIEEELNKL